MTPKKWVSKKKEFTRAVMNIKSIVISFTRWLRTMKSQFFNEFHVFFKCYFVGKMKNRCAPCPCDSIFLVIFTFRLHTTIRHFWTKRSTHKISFPPRRCLWPIFTYSSFFLSVDVEMLLRSFPQGKWIQHFPL